MSKQRVKNGAQRPENHGFVTTLKLALKFPKLVLFGMVRVAPIVTVAAYPRFFPKLVAKGANTLKFPRVIPGVSGVIGMAGVVVTGSVTVYFACWAFPAAGMFSVKVAGPVVPPFKITPADAIGAPEVGIVMVQFTQVDKTTNCPKLMPELAVSVWLNAVGSTNTHKNVAASWFFICFKTLQDYLCIQTAPPLY